MEWGTVTLDIGEYRFQNLRHYVERTFRHMAEAKQINFSIELAKELPIAMRTDTTRLQQILKNLLSNAFKFTSHGKVSLKIGMASAGWTSGHANLGVADAVLAFSVTDTGIGIPADKLQLIFEAFQQADGSTARKYGGTGLGLSISRELARLLNGEIRVVSEVGVGSRFTLFLPYNRIDFGKSDLIHHAYAPAPALEVDSAWTRENVSKREWRESAECVQFSSNPQHQAPKEATFDDRALIAPGDPSVLIVGDDARAAKILLDFAREKNFKCIVAAHGDSALTLARDYVPTAILLDIDASEADGVMVLDRLKRDTGTRHIPVHVISGQKERARCLRMGALSYLAKPIGAKRLHEEFLRIQQFLTYDKRRLLVVEDDDMQRKTILDLIGDSDVDIAAVDTGEEALRLLRESHFDCMVLDLSLPDVTGFELLDTIGKDPGLRDLPIVIYTAKELNRKEVAKLKRIAKTIVVKDARSP